MKKIHLLIVIILTFLSCKERIKMEKIANLYKEVKYHEQAISYQAEYFIELYKSSTGLFFFPLTVVRQPTASAGEYLCIAIPSSFPPMVNSST